MAKKTKNATKTKSLGSNPVVAFFKSRQIQTVIGSFLIFFSLFLFVAFVSFFFSWQEDQSIINEFSNTAAQGKNLLGKVGANLSDFFIYKGLGLGAFVIPYLLFLSGLYWLFRTKLSKIIISYNWGILSMIWISVSLGFIDESATLLSGVIGYEINEYVQLFIGRTGLGISLIFLLIAYITIRFKITPELIIKKFRSTKTEVSEPSTIVSSEIAQENSVPVIEEKSEFELSVENLQPTIQKHSEVLTSEKDIVSNTEEPSLIISEKENDTVKIDVEEITEEENVTENLSKKLVEDFGEFDPTLELGNFKFPTLNLLKQYNESISIDPEELEPVSYTHLRAHET